MDIEFFLKSRTTFIKYFYETAIKPFAEIKHSIENKIAPYVPLCNEDDDEPPFLDEWLTADAGVNTVGQISVSMLSSSLQLFLKAWVRRLEKNHGISFDKICFKKGWFIGYLDLIQEVGLNLDNCEADLEIIEQIILIRNRIQHPEQLTTISISHSDSDLAKFPNPYFANIKELEIIELIDGESSDWWVKPSIMPTQDKVFEAIRQVEILCNWLESGYFDVQRTN